MKLTNPSSSSRTIEQLELDHNRNLQPRARTSNQNRTTQNTLFSLLHPNARLACLNLISESMPSPVEAFEQVSSGAEYNGITYLPVGSRKSIARRELYLIEEAVHDVIGRRFGACHEALLAHFDMLVSPCDILEEQPDLRVLVIPNEVPGLNDWKGWIRQSVSSQFDLPAVSSCYSFVMAFGETQAKGEFALMDDAIADRHGADIIIPRRCLKPNSRAGFGPLSRSGKFAGRVVLGIKKLLPEELSTGEITLNLLDEHVCQPGCNSTSSRAMWRVVARVFQIRGSEPNGEPSCTQS
jgi:hypothetical protein